MSPNPTETAFLLRANGPEPVDPRDRVRIAAARRVAANHEWRQAIRDAYAAGVSQRQIAAAAGVTNPRINQIIHNA